MRPRRSLRARRRRRPSPVTRLSRLRPLGVRIGEHAAQELAQDQRVHDRRAVLGFDRTGDVRFASVEAVVVAGQVGLVGAAAVVVGAARVDREAERHRLQRARLIPGELEPLDVRGERLGSAADRARGSAAIPRRAGRRCPSRAPISSIARSSASASPNRSHGASIRPFSAHSIAHAIVPPVEIVSSPSSSQRELAAITASASLIAAQRSEREHVLVLHPGLLAPRTLVDVLAADRARRTGVARHLAQLGDLARRRAPRRPSNRGGREVAGRKRRDRVERQQVGHRPQLAVLRGRGAERPLAQVLGGGQDSRRVRGCDLGPRRGRRSPCTTWSPSRRPARPGRRDGRRGRWSRSGRRARPPDRSPPPARPVPSARAAVPRSSAAGKPHRSLGGRDPHRAAVDHEHRRLLRSAAHDDRVVAGQLAGDREVARGQRVGQPAGERGLRRPPRTSRSSSAGCRPAARTRRSAAPADRAGRRPAGSTCASATRPARRRRCRSGAPIRRSADAALSRW